MDFHEPRQSDRLELFGAVEQAFDGGGGPARSAARRALIHGFELRADLRERQIRIGPFDPGDKCDETFAADFSAGA
jgi:hypothetical protein